MSELTQTLPQLFVAHTRRRKREHTPSCPSHTPPPPSQTHTHPTSTDCLSRSFFLSPLPAAAKTSLFPAVWLPPIAPSPVHPPSFALHRSFHAPGGNTFSEPIWPFMQPLAPFPVHPILPSLFFASRLSVCLSGILVTSTDSFISTHPTVPDSKSNKLCSDGFVFFYFFGLTPTQNPHLDPD